MRNACKFWSENLKQWDHFEDLVEDRDTVMIDLRLEVVDWIYLAQDD
jgi:hypothetical protein